MTQQQNKCHGSCLCGKVDFDVVLKSTEIHVCHCRICQKWGGGSAMAVECEQDIEIKGEENLSWYRSSDEAERGFCKVCGSGLFFRLVPEYGQYLNVAATCLDDGKDFKITKHIFIDAKPPYYDFSDDSPRLTEKEFLAELKECKQ